MASQRLRDILPRPPLNPPPKQDPVKETLSKLGLTEEQFKAKQTEMMEVLLRNQPFMPKEPPPPQKAPPKLSTGFYEQMVAGSSRHTRGRSESVSSSSSRESSPAPRTPARRDQAEATTQRPRDKMELIIEQRNRAKLDRRRGSTSRQREDTRVPSTPTHSTARQDASNYPPETPHHYRYYSERVVGEASGSRRTLDQHGGPVTPSVNHDRGRFKVPLPPFLIPQTPSNREPNSSCPPTPRSSPPPVVNLVSSPGPMRQDPLEEDDRLYTLPPGPYSAIKPDLSYAAIIGQAILASPMHALALQDIYEFITTVYPYYKRGEPTWMNSVRHALSTMAVFRKVPRDRSEGKSLWAIWDCDLPCFDGGGFKKSLCVDMVNSAPPSKGSRKRAADESGGPKAKRRKAVARPSEDDTHPLPALTSTPMLPPYFPHVTPANPYHQPYYQPAGAQQQQLPAHVLFPPLPPSSNYHRVLSRAASTSAAQEAVPVVASTSDPSNSTDPNRPTPTTSPIERPSSSSSVPELVSSHSCSSSPALSSQLSLREESSRDPSPVVASASPMAGPIEDPDALWLQDDSPAPPQPVVAPKPKRELSKGKARADGSTVKKRSQPMPALPPPPSPTLERRAATTTRYGFRSPKKKAGNSPSKTSPAKVASSKAPVAPVVARPVTPPLMTASVEEIMRAMEQHAASGRLTRSPSPLSEVEVTAMVTSAYSDIEDADERPSTPEYPPSSSLPSTPPRRLEDLESELFNFSPFKSPHMRSLSRHGMSPTLIDDSHIPIPSLYSHRAPYLRPDNDDELLTGEAGSSTAHSPPIAMPRTPKRVPLQRPSSSRSNPRPMSPFGTPSRGTRSAFDDDFASFFQSPGGSSLFDPFLPSLSKSPILYGLQSPGFGGQY